MLNEMTPENIIVIYNSKIHEDVADQTEKIYNTKFSKEELDPDLAEELRTITFKDIEGEYMADAHISNSVNKFIPYNCELFDEEEEEAVVHIDLSQ